MRPSGIIGRNLIRACCSNVSPSIPVRISFSCAELSHESRKKRTCMDICNDFVTQTHFISSIPTLYIGREGEERQASEMRRCEIVPMRQGLLNAVLIGR